jgi:mRNA interferase RelE/StbE
MNVILHPKAGKFLKSLNEPNKTRIVVGLEKLSKDPPQGDIKPLSGGSGEYRLRIGDYRLLFKIHDNKILVLEIGLRGQIYKGR